MEKNSNPPPYEATGPGFVSPPGPGFAPPPPQYGGSYPQGHMLPPQAPVQVIATHLGPDPQSLTCPYCHELIVSRVESKPSTKTHLFALILCCFVCWPCAWIPYVVDSCQSRNHYCPNCSAYLGVYDQ